MRIAFSKFTGRPYLAAKRSNGAHYIWIVQFIFEQRSPEQDHEIEKQQAIDRLCFSIGVGYASEGGARLLGIWRAGGEQRVGATTRAGEGDREQALAGSCMRRDPAYGEASYSRRAAD